MLAAGQLWGVLRCEPAILSVEALAVSIFGEAEAHETEPEGTQASLPL